MDEIDFALCMLLVWNSRTPYRELAETFKMSVNSIHKRVKTLVSLAIIDKFTTNLNIPAYIPTISNLVMFGASMANNSEGLIDKLGINENIYAVSQHSDNFYIIHAITRNPNEIEPLVSFVKLTAEIPELKVGLQSSPVQSDTEVEMMREVSLSNTDYLIVNALKDNSRKTIVDIAEEIGSSTKTIRRRLDRLIENHLVHFTIHWYPDKCSEVIVMVILTLKPSIIVDKTEIIDRLREQYGHKILFTWTFSTLPNIIIISIWVDSMKELQNIRSSLISDNFELVSLNIGIEGKIFPTWREKYLEDKIKEIRDKTT